MALASSEAANPHWIPRAAPQSLEHIPGENGPPIIGNTFRLLRDPPAFNRQMIEKYGKVYRTRAFGAVNLSLIGAEANELMLFDRDKLFSSEQGWYVNLGDQEGTTEEYFALSAIIAAGR